MPLPNCQWNLRRVSRDSDDQSEGALTAPQLRHVTRDEHDTKRHPLGERLPPATGTPPPTLLRPLPAPYT